MRARGKAAESELSGAAGAAITVVSGLPRSGTSLVMQMLVAGGLPAFTDGVRGADENNPNGYFENSRVMALGRDSSWLGEARGHALKIVVPLLGEIPPEIDFRLVWIHRDLDEVLASQARMLEPAVRAKFADDFADEVALRRAFENQIDRARAQLARRGTSVLDIEHSRTLANPKAVARELCDFLGGNLDAGAAAAAVDTRLYRQRGSAATSR